MRIEVYDRLLTGGLFGNDRNLEPIAFFVLCAVVQINQLHPREFHSIENDILEIFDDSN